MSDDGSIFLSFSGHMGIFFVTLLASCSFIFPIYADMYDIVSYYTSPIHMSIFWVTRYVLVCRRFNPICGRCVVIT